MAKLTKEQLAKIQEYIQSLPEEEREPKLKEIASQFEDENPQCPFCLMSEEKIKTVKVYEDEYFLSVLEINPANGGHVLLFTKRHIKTFSDLNDDETENLGKIIKKISYSINKMADGINVIYSQGNSAGQKFDHFIINIIPRFNGDNVKVEWKGNPVDEEELIKLKEVIVKNFPQEKKEIKPIDGEKLKKDFHKTKKRLP